MSKTCTQIWDEVVDLTADFLAGEHQPDTNGLAKAKVARWACVAAWTIAAWKLWPVSHWTSLAVVVATVYTIVGDTFQNKLIYAVRDRQLLQRRNWVRNLTDAAEETETK